MKKLNVLILSALTAVSGSALAMGGSIEQGKNFTSLNVEMGKSTSGLYTEGSWLKNTDDGTHDRRRGRRLQPRSRPGDAERGRQGPLRRPEERR